jgi:hypothetical protein
MPEDQCLPLAGIIRDTPDPRDLLDAAGPGFGQNGSGRPIKKPEAKDCLEIPDSDEDSSELSSLASSEFEDEPVAPGLLTKASKQKALPDLVEKDILTHDFDLEQEDSFLARPSVKLVIPDHIKAILVDDWENVTKNQQLVPLPCKHSVNAILKDYVESERPKRQPGSAQADILEEVVAGLNLYFEKCLGRILLYR